MEIHHRGHRDIHFGIPVPPALRMPRIAQVVQARKEAEMLSSKNTRKDRAVGRAMTAFFLSPPLTSRVLRVLHMCTTRLAHEQPTAATCCRWASLRLSASLCLSSRNACSAPRPLYVSHGQICNLPNVMYNNHLQPASDSRHPALTTCRYLALGWRS